VRTDAASELHVNRSRAGDLLPLPIDEHPDIAAAVKAVDLTALSAAV
jgi:hypothetical protein